LGDAGNPSTLLANANRQHLSPLADNFKSKVVTLN